MEPDLSDFRSETANFFAIQKTQVKCRNWFLRFKKAMVLL